MNRTGWRCWCLFLMAWAGFAADWTDRAEYDLALAVRAEPSPKARLQLLDQWKARYPKSAMAQVRRELYLSTHQALGDSDGMLAAAAEMASAEPGNLVGLFWCAVLIPGARNASEETLQVGERAARALLTGMPAAEALARRALGWIRWQRGDYPGAREELTACLKQDPANAEASTWLGTVLALEKQPDQQPAALWHLARAAALSGEGALPERQQRQIGGLLDRLYASYHGDASGLDQLRSEAAKATFPPADFKIETAAALAQRRQEEELERSNPLLANWLRIRRRLEGPEGEQYFIGTLRGTPLPRLRGAVIRSSPARRPTEVVLALRDAATEEVILRLNAPLTGDAASGVLIEFEGLADAFTLSPFTLTVIADREKVEGWPAGVPATPPRQ